MGELRLLFFAMGTFGFFVTLYLSIRNPEPAKAQQPVLEEAPANAAMEATEKWYHPVNWQTWDRAATWLMWGGWGAAGVITFLDRNKEILGSG